MTQPVTVVQQEARPSDHAFERLVKHHHKVVKSAREFVEQFAHEWRRLPNQNERVRLAQLFGWSYGYAQKIANTGQKTEQKLALISDPAAPAPVLSGTVAELVEIAHIPNHELRRAAKAGFFSTQKSTRDIRSLKHSIAKKKIQKAKDAETAQHKTPIGKVKRHLEKAGGALGRATWEISAAVDVMDEHNIYMGRGPVVKALYKKFEELCAAFAAANPDTYETAIKILRGEK